MIKHPAPGCKTGRSLFLSMRNYAHSHSAQPPGMRQPGTMIAIAPSRFMSASPKAQQCNGDVKLYRSNCIPSAISLLAAIQGGAQCVCDRGRVGREAARNCRTMT
jgi:hypothetical protein